MGLEPKECRLQALTCERLAERSTSPILKVAYADLAKRDPSPRGGPAKEAPQKEEAPDSVLTGASQNGGSAA